MTADDITGEGARTAPLSLLGLADIPTINAMSALP